MDKTKIDVPPEELQKICKDIYRYIKDMYGNEIDKKIIFKEFNINENNKEIIFKFLRSTGIKFIKQDKIVKNKSYPKSNISLVNNIVNSYKKFDYLETETNYFRSKNKIINKPESDIESKQNDEFYKQILDYQKKHSIKNNNTISF